MQLTNSPLFHSLGACGAQLYTSERIFLDRDTLVVFTCGAASESAHSARTTLLEYAKRYFVHGSFFRAEDAFPALLKSKHDLLTIENQLADYADCIVLINESPGTLAELGAFASNDRIVEKLLVLNPLEHRDAKSFINLGPIAKIDRKSRFARTIHIDLKTASRYFDEVLKRIEEHAVRKRRLGVDFSQAGAWQKNDRKPRLLLLQDIVNLFCPLTENELISLMKAVLRVESVNYDAELGLLLATQKVMKRGEHLVTATSCASHSYDVERRAWLGLRKRVLDLYRSEDACRLNHLLARSGDSR